MPPTYRPTARKPTMNRLLALLLILPLTACVWETYETPSGGLSVRQRYPTGTPLIHQNGHHSLDPRYHDHRPRVLPVHNQATHP